MSRPKKIHPPIKAGFDEVLENVADGRGVEKIDTMPTKEEIREKYGIAEEDFVVLTAKETPSKEELLQEKSFLEKKGYWNGFEVWLKKSIIEKIVVAVIFIGGFSFGLEQIAKYGYIIYANQDAILDYTDNLGKYIEGQAKGLLAHTDFPPTEEDKQNSTWAIMPTGIQLYPVSGSWKPS